MKSFIEQAHDATGRLDVLFNNAGMGFGYKVHDMPEGVFEHHVSVHLFGTIYGMRYALPIMKKQNYGRIINTISRNAETDVEGTRLMLQQKRVYGLQLEWQQKKMLNTTF